MKGNVKEIILEAIKKRDMNQRQVSLKLGHSGGQWMQNLFCKASLRVDTFCMIMNLLDYDVTITDRITGKTVWTVDGTSEDNSQPDKRGDKS